MIPSLADGPQKTEIFVRPRVVHQDRSCEIISEFLFVTLQLVVRLKAEEIKVADMVLKSFVVIAVFISTGYIFRCHGKDAFDARERGKGQCIFILTSIINLHKICYLLSTVLKMPSP